MVADSGGQAVAVLPVHGRKLIAVVYADMAGYSRLIGLDDAGTFERLQELRRDLIDPALVRHGGTLVNTAGDSLLVTFDSIIPAMRFAVDVQRGVPDFDGDYAPDRRMRFRMGVNVGDVIPDGTNLHGDGVNIAARLQAICPPGAICVARIVRDHVGHRLGLDFKELGAIGLKNIARPTEAFLLQPTPPAGARSRLLQKRRTALLAGLGLLSVATAIVSGLELAPVHLRLSSPAQQTVDTPATPPRLSIALVPFSIVDPNHELGRLAEEISQDLATDLAQLTNSLISSKQWISRAGDEPISPQKIGQTSNVRYVLTGNLRRAGGTVHANVALISSESGVTLWGDQLDVDMPQDAMEQDEITGWLRNSVRRQLVKIEAARSARERPAHPDELDLVLQGDVALSEPPSAMRGAKAQALYEQALQLDSASVVALTGLADTLVNRVTILGEDLTGADLDRAEELMAAAEAVAPAHPRVLWTSAYILRVRQLWPEAAVAFEHVLSVYPHLDGAVLMLGICKLQLGQSEEAIPLFQKVLRDDPHNPNLWATYFRLGQASLLTGHYEEAIRWIQRVQAAAPEQPARQRAFYHAMMASAYALARHAERAREEVVAANSLWPYLTVRSFLGGSVVNETFAEQIERVRKGVGLAGLRDYVDENEDFGIVPDSRLRTELFGKTPLTAPGAAVIRTPELAAQLHDGRPLVIDASPGNQTLQGAISVYEAGFGGTFEDSVQERLRDLMGTLTGGDLSRPIVTLGQNAERWTGYNLALRLVALGFRRVYWYRGGREAWEAEGLPMAQVPPTELAAH